MKAWSIVITCCGEQMGEPIPATMWDVLSRLGAVKQAIPEGWAAEAYPVI